VSVNSEDKIPFVVKLLAKHNISSAPVRLANSTSKWVGLIDILDLVSTLSTIIEAKMDDTNTTQVNWDEISLVNDQCVGDLCDISEQNPWISISRDTSLEQILHKMAKKSNIHRLPVIDDKHFHNSSTTDGDIVGLLTQSAVLNFVFNHREKIPENKKQLIVEKWYKPKSTNFISAVETVDVTEKTYKAFKKNFSQRNQRSCSTGFKRKFMRKSKCI